jgi:hypothetical protein
MLLKRIFKVSLKILLSFVQSFLVEPKTLKILNLRFEGAAASATYGCFYWGTSGLWV